MQVGCGMNKFWLSLAPSSAATVRLFPPIRLRHLVADLMSGELRGDDYGHHRSLIRRLYTFGSVSLQAILRAKSGSGLRRIRIIGNALILDHPSNDFLEQLRRTTGLDVDSDPISLSRRRRFLGVVRTAAAVAVLTPVLWRASASRNAYFHRVSAKSLALLGLLPEVIRAKRFGSVLITCDLIYHAQILGVWAELCRLPVWLMHQNFPDSRKISVPFASSGAFVYEEHDLCSWKPAPRIVACYPAIAARRERLCGGIGLVVGVALGSKFDDFSSLEDAITRISREWKVDSVVVRFHPADQRRNAGLGFPNVVLSSSTAPLQDFASEVDLVLVDQLTSAAVTLVNLGVPTFTVGQSSASALPVGTAPRGQAGYAPPLPTDFAQDLADIREGVYRVEQLTRPVCLAHSHATAIGFVEGLRRIGIFDHLSADSRSSTAGA